MRLYPVLLFSVSLLSQTPSSYDAARTAPLKPRQQAPEWMDWKKVSDGLAFGQKYRGLIGFVWGTTSFYETLGVADAGPMFAATGTIANDPKRGQRTGQEFGRLVAMAPDAEAFVANNYMRARSLGLMHLGLAESPAIRSLGWKSPERVFFNQQAYAMIIHSFALRPLLVLSKSGRLSLEQEREGVAGWLHMWTVLANGMGLDRNLAPVDFETAVRRESALRQRQLIASDGLLLRPSITGILKQRNPTLTREQAVDNFLQRIKESEGLAEALGLGGPAARESLLALPF